MPADAPRATADDRLASAESADGEAAPSDAPPATRPTNGNGGPAAPSVGASSGAPVTGGNGTVADEDSDDDGGFAALLAEVEGRAPHDSAAGVAHANGGFPDPDPSLRQTSPGLAVPHDGPGGDATVVGDGTGVPPAPGIEADGAGATGGERSSRRSRLLSGRGREGRRIRQRLWAIDPWSVFKISVMFYACMFVVVLVAGTVLWNVGRSSGVIDEFEGFITQIGAYGECVAEGEVAAGTEFVSDDDCPDGTVRVDSFVLDDGTIFKSTLITAVVVAITGSAANVLMVVLLNLITEVSGGLKYTIIREPTGPARRRGLLDRLSGSLPSSGKR